MLIIDSEINFTVNNWELSNEHTSGGFPQLRHVFLGPTQQTDPNNINVSMSPASAFV